MFVHQLTSAESCIPMGTVRHGGTGTKSRCPLHALNIGTFSLGLRRLLPWNGNCQWVENALYEVKMSKIVGLFHFSPKLLKISKKTFFRICRSICRPRIQLIFLSPLLAIFQHKRRSKTPSPFKKCRNFIGKNWKKTRKPSNEIKQCDKTVR